MRQATGFLALTLVLCTLACTAPTQAPTTSGDEPKYGGIARARVPIDPASGYDQSILRAFPASESYFLAYNTPLSYKRGPGVEWQELALAPELAERWEVSPDARTYTFWLRKGVRFANLPPVHGRELTSADVKWSYEYWSRTGQHKALRPANYGSWMFEGLTGIETPDSSTVIVRFEKPFAPFLNYAATWRVPVVPHEIYDADGHLTDQIVGTGAFQLDKSTSQPGSRWVWKKNPDYWENGKPYLDAVHWIVLGDDASSYAAFQSRQLDYLGNSGLSLGFNSAQELQKALPDAVLFEHLAPATGHLYLNARSGKPLADIRLRKAISLALNPDEFIKTLTGGRGKWGFAGAAPDTFTESEVKALQRYDPAQAKQLVRDAAPNGITLEMQYPGRDYGDDLITAMELIQARLKDVGITAVFKTVDKPTFSKAKTAGTYELIYTDSQSFESDIDSLLFANYQSSSAKNYTGAADPKLDRLVEAQRREPDPAKRREIVREAVRYINVEMVYDIGTNFGVEYEAWQPYLKGVYSHSSSRNGLPLAGAWLGK